MAVLEKNGLLTYKDTAGNKTLLYPITKKECVDGMEDIDAHLENQQNPHGVTAEQAGAIPVPATPGTAGQVLTLDDQLKPVWRDNEGGSGALTIKSIKITKQPNKTNYLQGETFDPTGMVVTGEYAISGVVITEAEITGYSYPSSGLADGQTKVAISYTEGGATVTTEVAITVTHRLTAINVAGGPTKTSYEYGDTLNTAGLSIRATYSDGATATVTGWTCSLTALNTVGQQTITVTYIERGVSKTTTFSVSVARQTISTLPTQDGSLTYNGSVQTPTLKDYDSDKMTLSVTGQKNAGTYSAIVTPKANYRWADGSIADKTVTWTIGKAAGSLSISPTSVTFNASTKSAAITVTRAGDGAISAVSSNTAIATVSVSGNTVTISAPSETSGSATITIKVAAGTNYTAPSDKTVSVTAAFKPTASPNMTAGINYTSGLSGITQAKLSEYAEAISSNAAITNTTSVVYIEDGSKHIKLSVGDKVAITLTGTSYDFQIIGFNHDDLNTAAAYGATTATGKAGITLQMVDCFATTFNMNSSNTNAGGWKNSAMRTTHLATTLKGYLPAAWKNVIKTVKKKSSAGSKSTTIETTADDLFLLSEVEVFGSTTYSVAGEGAQYAWYKAGNTKVKKLNGSAFSWWERSPRASNTASFCYVISNGNADSSYASYSRGVAFGFCV